MHAVADKVLWAACSVKRGSDLKDSISGEGWLWMDEEVREEVAFLECCLLLLYFVFLCLNRR